MDLRGYLSVVWRRRWLPILVALLGATAVWLIGPPAAPDTATYQATATLAVNNRDTGSSVLLYSHVATESNQFHEQAAVELGPNFYDGRNTVDVLVQSMTVTAVPEIGTVTLILDDQPSEEAAGRAIVTFGEQIISYATDRQTIERDDSLAALEVRERELEGQINSLEDRLESLRAQQSEEERSAGQSPDRVLEVQLGAAISSLNQALAEGNALQSLTDDDLTPLGYTGSPTVQANEIPKPPLGFAGRLGVSVLISLLLGIGLVFVLHRLDTRIFNRKDAEGAFRLPVLAEVRRVRWLKRRNYQIFTRDNPHALASESYRLLRTNIARALDSDQVPDRSGRGAVVAVASVSAAVGKSTTVANLAAALVDAGQTVLVVSADLREPTIHRFFAVEPEQGLVEAAAKIRGGVPAASILDEVVVTTNTPGVSLLPHGSGSHTVPNPGETLADVRPLLYACRFRFDVVLIDTPPMLAGNDVGELAAAVDLTVLVARSSLSTIEEGEWAVETAALLRAPVGGLVLIGSRSQLERRGGRRRTVLQRMIARVSQLFGRGRRGKKEQGAAPEAGLPVTTTQDRGNLAGEAVPAESQLAAVEAPGSAELTSGKPAPVDDMTKPIELFATSTAQESTMPIEVVATVPDPGRSNGSDKPRSESSIAESSEAERTPPTELVLPAGDDDVEILPFPPSGPISADDLFPQETKDPVEVPAEKVVANGPTVPTDLEPLDAGVTVRASSNGGTLNGKAPDKTPDVPVEEAPVDTTGSLRQESVESEDAGIEVPVDELTDEDELGSQRSVGA